MDALIYTAMSGAERAMRAQQVHANNLANLETGGFRADLELATSQAVPGYGFDARHASGIQTNAVTSREGAKRETGRDLDVAITGPGFFAVQTAQGEAYTRSGSFSLDGEGGLMVDGRPVLGDGGPITLPPYTRVAIAQDGSIAIQPPGQETMQTVDKLKLVTAPPGSLTKNEAGLIVSRSGNALPTNEAVRVQGGYLEGSNVSAIDEMVSTMTLNRDFELQMKLYKATDSMADTGNRLIRE